MTTRSVCRVILVAAALLLGPESRASADTTTQAQAEGRERFRRGVALYREGDYRAALIEFKRANQVAPSFRIQYNIAQTCLELQDYACALQGYESYLSLGGKDVPKDRRAISEKEIARLRKLVATVEVVSNKEGADVLLDDVSIGTTPLSPILVGAGRHRITVALAPLPAQSKVIDVAGGDRLELRLDLVEAPLVTSEQTPAPVITPRLSTPAPIEPPPPRRAQPSRTPFYVGLLATGVLAAGTGVSGVVALGAKSGLDEAVDKIDPTSKDIDDSRSRLRTWSTITDVLLASTVVAAGVTTVLYFSTRAGGSARVGVAPGAAVLSGSF